jgi:hypothetical protein
VKREWSIGQEREGRTLQPSLFVYLALYVSDIVNTFVPGTITVAGASEILVNLHPRFSLETGGQLVVTGADAAQRVVFTAADAKAHTLRGNRLKWRYTPGGWVGINRGGVRRKCCTGKRVLHTTIYNIYVLNSYRTFLPLKWLDISVNTIHRLYLSCVLTVNG